MAYEQVAGESVSPQTDIWAFGLITYFLLTGQRYWPAASRPDASMPALFAEIVNLPLVPPSERLRQQGIPIELPTAFDAWLLRCLDRKPSQRFASAGRALIELRTALRQDSRRTLAEPQPPRVARVAPPGIAGASQSRPPVASERLGTASLRPRALARPLPLAGAALALMALFGVWLLTHDAPVAEPATELATETSAPAAAPDPPPSHEAARPNQRTDRDDRTIPTPKVQPVSDLGEIVVRPLPDSEPANAPEPTNIEPANIEPARTEPPAPKTEPAPPKPSTPPCKFDPYTGRCLPAPVAPTKP
jgi:serine/threonine protein kinase